MYVRRKQAIFLPNCRKRLLVIQLSVKKDPGILVDEKISFPETRVIGKSQNIELRKEKLK